MFCFQVTSLRNELWPRHNQVDSQLGLDGSRLQCDVEMLKRADRDSGGERGRGCAQHF